MPFARYLILTNGKIHRYIGVPKNVYTKLRRERKSDGTFKNKKLTIYGYDKSLINRFLQTIIDYAPRNQYTSRGFIAKGMKFYSKKSKKDLQKNKSF